MSDSTEKDFRDFLVTQLGKLEPQAPQPTTYTDTHAQSYVHRKPDTCSQTEAHTVTDTHTQTPADPDAHTDIDTYRHRDTNSPKQSLCTKK